MMRCEDDAPLPNWDQVLGISWEYYTPALFIWVGDSCGNPNPNEINLLIRSGVGFLILETFLICVTLFFTLPTIHFLASV